MTNDPRHSNEQGLAAGSPPLTRRWYRSVRTIALTWLSIAAAPALWASVDSASAMGFRGHAGFHAVAARQEAARVAARRGTHFGPHRPGMRIVRVPPRNGDKPPRRPIRPRRPIVI